MCAFSVCLLVTINCQDFSADTLGGCILLKIDPNEAYEVFFFTSTFSVDVNKHLICLIWTRVEYVLTFGYLEFWRLALIANLSTFSVLWKTR